MKTDNRLFLDCLKAWLGEKEASPELVERLENFQGEISTSDGASLAAMDFALKKLNLVDYFPPDQINRLARYKHFNVANGASMFLDLDTFLQETDRENIPVLLLKGLALIKGGVFPGKGLRLMSDLDVLVRDEDIDRVEKLLDRIGWMRDENECELHEKHHMPVRIGPHGTLLEVHFALSRIPMPVDNEEMWERSAALDNYSNARIPSLEDTLIHLVLNAALHHPDKLVPLHLKLVSDFAFIWNFRGRRLDWKYIDRKVREMGVVTPFWNAVSVSGKLLDPPGFDEAVASFGIESKADGGFVDMLVSSILDGESRGELSWLVVLAAEEKNPLKRVYKYLQVLFPPRTFMRQAYPDWDKFPKSCFAYVVRLFKVLRNINFTNFAMARKAGRMSRTVNNPD